MDKLGIIKEEKRELRWKDEICIYHLHPFVLDSVETFLVIDSEQCDIEIPKFVHEPEQRIVKHTFMQCHPFNRGEITQYSGCEILGHTGIEDTEIAMVFETAIIMVGESLYHHPLFYFREIFAQYIKRRNLVGNKEEIVVLFKE